MILSKITIIILTHKIVSRDERLLITNQGSGKNLSQEFSTMHTCSQSCDGRGLRGPSLGTPIKITEVDREFSSYRYNEYSVTIVERNVHCGNQRMRITALN